MVSTNLVWADPPTLERMRGRIRSFVLQLKARPGEWAICPPAMKLPTEAYKRRDRYPGTEWRAVKRDDGLFDIYARWVGDPPAT